MEMRPKEQLRNRSDEDDFLQGLEEVEAITVDAMAEAKQRYAAEVAKLKDDAKRKIEMIVRENSIDKKIFKESLADRAEDRAHFAKKQKRAAKMPADRLEYWVDVSGQISFIPPGEPAPADVVETMTQRANREAQEAIDKISVEEAAIGESVFGKAFGGEED